MLTGNRLLEAFDAWTSDSPLAETGLSGLDDLTGGLLAGHVWVITGDVGEGKTTLLSQLAVALGSAGAQVQLVCPREPAAWTAKRLLACLGRIKIDHPAARSHPQQPRFDQARGTLGALPLAVYAMDTVRFIPEQHPYATSSAAVLVDDADLVGGMTPDRAELYAREARFVAVTLPRDQVFSGSGDRAPLRAGWGRISDVVVEVRTRTIADRGAPATPGHRPADLRPGEAELVVHRHRRGHTRTLHAAAAFHYARFRDLPPHDTEV